MFLHNILSAVAAVLVARVFAAVEAEVKSIPLRTHSLHQPYLDSDLQSRWWDFGGDAIIRTDSYVRLASDRPSQRGWIFSRVPLTATSWEVQVEFAITGHGHLYGDGLGIFMTNQRAQEGTVFGAQDKFEGLGVFIDTYKNNRPGTVFPYVMAMLGDGNTAYDQASDGKANELAGCSARGVRNAQFPTKIKITYMADKQLAVKIMYKKQDEWTECFEISDVHLPQVAYLGFSAATGELSDNFDIISVDTRNLYAPGGSGSQAGKAQTERGGRASHGKGGSSARSSSKSNTGGTWTWTLLKLVLFGMVCGGAYVGFTIYRAQQRDRF